MATATRTGDTVSTMKWEKFMPRMMMRVLLVEADDSTRQVVAALLHKCSYRVEAVTDGLEAWEILKEKPQNFDLILAEVDLPSITGFALLTLVMEHDICRNVPFIMMSSHGLVANVYKCMQRGAADYLVKPIRRNELRNLWQHVWRRQSINVDGSRPQSKDEMVPLRETEATAESNQISQSINRAQADDEFTQKQTDIQSSCTKADDEAAKASLSPCSFALNPSPSANAELEISRKDENWAAKEAIDLISTFQNYQQSHYCIDSSSHHHSLNLEYPLQLDLCLKRTEPLRDIGSVLAVKKSGATSAFSRYINKTLHTEKQLPHDLNSSDTPNPALCTQQKTISSLSNTQSQQPLPLSRDRSLPTSVPVTVLRSDSSCTDFSSEIMVSQQGLSQFLHRNNHGQTLESLNHSLRLEALRDKASCCPSTNVNQVFHITPSEEGLMHDGNSQQSLLQREAALMKFRSKRKLRCFNKKVRYESRKKLAEKRPRVKGQFVRHVNVDTVRTPKKPT